MSVSRLDVMGPDGCAPAKFQRQLLHGVCEFSTCRRVGLSLRSAGTRESRAVGLEQTLVERFQQIAAQVEESSRDDLLPAPVTVREEPPELATDLKGVTALPAFDLEAGLVGNAPEKSDLAVLPQVEDDVIRSGVEIAVPDEEADKPQQRL